MTDEENPLTAPDGDTVNIGGIDSAFASVPPSDILNSGNESVIALISGTFVPVARTNTNIAHPLLPESARNSTEGLADELHSLLVPYLPQPANNLPALPANNNSPDQDDMPIENMNDIENYDGSLEISIEE